MKIAAFYENIVTAYENAGKSLREVLTELKGYGLQQIYLSGDSYEKDHGTLTPLMDELGLTYAGFHQYIDFAHHPEETTYRKYIDMVKESGADNLLLVPGLIPEGEEENRGILLENMAYCLKKAIAYAETQGIMICMEDYDNAHAPINCAAGMDYFFDRLPGLKCAYDSGNFCYYSENEWETFLHFADKVVIMHVKDRGNTPFSRKDQPFVCENGEKAYCVPVGTGTMQIPKSSK